MSYFNQSKYSESTSSEVPESVEKGHKNITKVDIGKFDEICKKFKEMKHMKVKKLVGQDKEDFDLVISYVQLLYGTNYYSQLYEKVRKHFENTTSVRPGTVGAYFAGCLVTLKDNNAGCNITCAGSMPLPKEEEGWSFCDKAVIMAEKNGNGYSFSFVKPANSEEEMNPAYLFVDSTSLQDFSGFSKEEKDQILAMGCKKAKVVGYGSDMTYSDLYKEPKSVSEIKHRSTKQKEKKKIYKKKDENWNILWWFLIIFFIIIVIACAFGYKHYKKSQ